MDGKKRRLLFIVISLLFLFTLSIFLSRIALTKIGEFLIANEKPVRSDAVIVLNSGVELYPRLIEAGELYRKNMASRVVINGNRKTDVIRNLEKKGFRPCCPWYENLIRVLALMGVPREKIIIVSAEDAYDTVTEAEIVGKEILEKGFKRIIITTSKYHTRRAYFIWSRLYGNKWNIYPVSAKKDPFNPKGWWKEGRQIRWVLAEYGAWVYDWWKIRKY